VNVDRRIVSALTLVAVASVFQQVRSSGGSGEVKWEVQSTGTTASPTSGRIGAAPTSPSSNPSANQQTEKPCPVENGCDALVPYRETGPWTASCDFFVAQGAASPDRGESVNLEGNDPESIGTERKNWCAPSQAYDMQFMIVTLPDPLATHLALYFDRTVEAVGAAAQTCGFYFDHYWLPWQVPGNNAAAGDTSQDLRVNEILDSFRVSQPGLMIFRATAGPGEACAASDPANGPDHLLYVFLVSESPTTGINKTQFANAVSYARTLKGAAPTVHVVGPFFSGSVPSLKLVDSTVQNQAALDFVSGTMTSKPLMADLRSTLRARGREFKQTLHDDQRAEEFVLGFLWQRGLTRDGSNVAILSEDQTQYVGEDPRRFTGVPYPKIRRITFPRGVSRLRNAYPDSFGTAAYSAGQAVQLPEQRLPWNWKDTSKDNDSVPAFSGTQVPLSQEAIMYSISDTIRDENIRYVGIVATDIFDILFLSKFLKTAAPNTRLFLLDADILMLKMNDAGNSLEGTLAVTTYPLFVRNNDWTHRGLAAITLLPSRMYEGIFNAVLFHLDEDHDRPLREYADPLLVGSQINNRPPLWLTMVGESAFWPVSLKENAAKDQDAPTPRLVALPHSSSLRGSLEFDPPDGVTLFLQALLLVWGILHLLGMWFGPKKGPEWLGQFRVSNSGDGRVHVQHRAFYLVCGTLALSAMLLLIVVPFLRLWWDGHIAFVSPWLFYPFYLFYILMGFGLLLTAWKITTRHVWTAEEMRGVWFPWAVFGVTLSVWIYLNARPIGDGIFFAQRAFYLSDGVSPLLPFELLLWMYYVWAWMFIRKVRLSECKKARVPDPELMGRSATGMNQLVQELEEATDDLMFDRKLAPWLIGGFTVLFVFVLRPWEQLGSVEGRVYDYVVAFLVLFICILVLATWGRFLRIWNKLRGILRGLERTPLRKAFDRFPRRAYSWSPLWHGDAGPRAYTISARSVQCYQALMKFDGGEDAQLAAFGESMKAVFERVVEADATEHADNGQSYTVGALQGIFVDASEHLLNIRLRPQWEEEGGSDTLDDLNERGSAKDAPSRDEEERYLAEEFVALRYVGLIHYESAQLKNLVVLLSAGFVLALAAVGSYPFLSRRECVWTLAGVFLVFGVGIVMSFAQMDRDSILSRLSGTESGKLDRDFYLRVVSYGALPLLALLASQFPSFGRFLFSWVEPGLNALH